MQPQRWSKKNEHGTVMRCAGLLAAHSTPTVMARRNPSQTQELPEGYSAWGMVRM